jgi:hypothetical protein
MVDSAAEDKSHAKYVHCRLLSCAFWIAMQCDLTANFWNRKPLTTLFFCFLFDPNFRCYR